jgi:RNA polymerase subunit RPABC4/transcription elongation factor Spt4
MALKHCPECNKEVSDRATRCPHCGFQHPPRTATQAIVGAFLIIAAFIFALFIAGAFGQCS